MKKIQIDIGILESLLSDILQEASQWIEASCGRVSLNSKLAVGVEGSDIHQAVTEVDLELQERILQPLISKFPDMTLPVEVSLL